MTELNVFEIRKRAGRIGETQATFAKALDVPLKTVQNWEQGRRKPTGPARSLLMVVQYQPTVLSDAMQAAVSPAG
jgi:DNA-binding transcriptional regulator YiaG